MNFPTFDGTDVRIWIDKCFAYSAMYHILSNLCVFADSIHMTGVAVHWFQSYKHTPGFQVWDQFVLAVIAEFEVDTHGSKTMELLNLRQSGLMDEYRKTFEHLVYNIRLFDLSLNDTMLTAQFLLGLKPELRSPVCREATAWLGGQGCYIGICSGAVTGKTEEKSQQGFIP
jgi:hypothetical protein